MASSYPPGVTGNEFEIAGPDYERESDTPCARCGGTTTELGYRRDRWLCCDECGEEFDLPSDEPDPDRAYDEARERLIFGDE